MHTRQNALNEWLNKILPENSFQLTPLAGDASFRQYFRLKIGDKTHVVMDAPPEKELVSPYIQIGQTLRKIGVHAPEIHAADEQNGFLLIEDLGDELLLKALSPDRAQKLYKAAMHTLAKLQQNASTTKSLPVFDKTFMIEQMRLFDDWFISKYLRLELTDAQSTLIQSMLDWISEELLKQPKVFIHCDYHSRNLIVVTETDTVDLGVIDFQDAMIGPFTYDLVSLLKDCYIQWPREQTLQWLEAFYESLPETYGWSLEAFTRGFDLCGIQRHLKVLGIFSRLHLRDGKSVYLQDLPLVMNYVIESLSHYPELSAFNRFMKEIVQPKFIEIHSA